MRRLLRFRLKSLLVVLSIVAVWFGLHARSARQQEIACNEITRLNGTIEYSYQFDDDLQFVPSAFPPYPSWFRRILGHHFFDTVFFVDFQGCKDVTNNDLAILNQLPSLMGLDLAFTNATGEGLQYLNGMSSLRALRIESITLGDRDLVYISSLKKLAYLEMPQTNISDAGLKYLSGLRNLRLLDLSYTDVTEEGIATLQSLLPDCEILH